MKVVLCNPPQPVSFFPKIPPLGIAYLGSLLREHGHDVVLYDLNIRLGSTITHQDISDVAKDIADHEPDIMGVSCWAMCMPFVSELVQQYKLEYDGLVLLGGPYPSLAPAETIRGVPADCCVVGEGELPLLDIADAPQRVQSIENVWAQKGDTLIQNPRRQDFYPLDDLPYPALDLLPPVEEYQNMKDEYWYMEEPTYEFPVMASRGCPYRCGFCSTRKIWTTHRRRDPKNVVREIKHLVREYGDIFIDFQDDMFTLNKAWVTSICKNLSSEGITATWSCCTRVDRVDDGILATMKAAGCTNIDLGIESINDRVLEYIHKGYTSRDVRKGLSTIIKHGIQAETTYIVNLPVETKEDIMKTIDFGEESLREGISEVTFYLLTPYPGIDLLEEQAIELMPSPYRDNLLKYTAGFSKNPERYDNPFWLPEAFTIVNPFLTEEDFWEIFERIHAINATFPPYPLSFYRGETP
ncbi:MAG: B12-binding domain-containing radical SAM protein [Theionarchaea archaeon]|nr:B12-binding domain-containing radical SAM protein [Theionarchaea archaeon]